jgi:transcriptional regulator with XRE-family HTH domain
VRVEEADRLVLWMGKRVAELRRARGMTQAQLAERADFSIQYLQRIEAGRENLTVRSAARIAQLLGCRFVELFRRPTTTIVRRGRPPRPRR